MLDGFDDGPNSERLWNPTTGIFHARPVRAQPLLRRARPAPRRPDADRRRAHQLRTSVSRTRRIYNPRRRRTSGGADMAVGRWYPTATLLPDGRVLAFAGDNIVQDRPGTDAAVRGRIGQLAARGLQPERRTRGRDLPSAKLTSPLYPFMFVLSDGRVLDAGPDTTTRILDTAVVDVVDGRARARSTAQRRDVPAEQDHEVGCLGRPRLRRGQPRTTSDGRTAVIDMNARNARLARDRADGVRALLPQPHAAARTARCSRAAAAQCRTASTSTNAVLPAEIWNPDTETWTTVASLTKRAPLPLDGPAPARRARADGRRRRSCPARSRSTRRTPRSTRRRTSSRAHARRSPPHPRRCAYGSDASTSTTPDAAQIAHVSLIRSPSVTHAIDMNQRFQFLNFTQAAGKLTVHRAGERQPRAARRLHALPRRHERRAVGRQVPARAGRPTPPPPPSRYSARSGVRRSRAR